MRHRPLLAARQRFCGVRNWRNHKRLDRPSNVPQIECSKLLKSEAEAVTNMVAHRTRDADGARRTFGLKPCRYIDDITMDIGAIWNHIADVNADAEADRLIGREVVIMDWNLLLDVHRATHCPG